MSQSLCFIPSETSVRAGLFSKIQRHSTGLRLAVLVAALAAIAIPNHAHAAIQVQPNTEGNTGGSCSLQEAIYATEFGQAVALGQTDPDNAYATGCNDPAGTWNEIDLPGGTLTFTKSWDGDAHNPFGPTATPIIFSTITIHGHGTTLQWNGPELYRLFAIGYASITFGPQGGALTNGTYSGTGNLTLQDVYVKGFQAKGGDGVGVGFCCLGGGGGGLGAGGAIYVGEIPGAPGVPVLTVQNSTFEGNGATGGNGGGGVTSGGGGIGGNGGDAGGGGSRGNGGNLCANYPSCPSGGGGGGTVFDGSPDGPGGYLCGGSGGSSSHHDGHDATCPGGGGGGAYYDADDGNGGNGAFGGGGGGVSATKGNQNGGHGGFGGGGGGGWGNGGSGGFGGGGGAGFGHGGAFGGNASDIGAGGGGALGGAIFNDSGTVVVQNSTFYNNSVTRGLANCPNCDQAADNGGDSGGAIFSRNGSLTVQNGTISGNQATGAGGGIVVYNDGSATTFILDNTIIANNGAQECIMEGSGTVTTSSGGVSSSANMIVNNSAASGSQHPCPSSVSSDPLLDSLPKLNSPGDTPTLALKAGSPAVDAGDDTYILGTDQRGVPRPVGAHGDIGAYERIPQADFSITKSVGNSTAKAGDTVTYTLTVTNVGDPATSVTVTDNFPTGLTFVSCSAPGGSCATQSAAVVATYSTFAANSSQTITITGTLKSGFARGTVISNDASVQASSPTDPDTSNNSASVSFTVIVPDFTIAAVTPLNILVASNADSKVTIGSIDTFSSPVSLTATGPAGFHETFSVTPVTPPSNGSANSNMNVRLEPSVTVGTYTVTATGTSGSLTHSFDVTVNVVTSLPAMMSVVNGDLALGCIDNSGIGGALNAKLSAALAALNAGQTQTEVNTLQALLNQLSAQAGKHIKTVCVDGSGSTFNADATLISDVNNLLSNAGASPKDPIVGNVLNANGAGVAGVSVSLLTSKNAMVASATTDAMGYYYFPATSGLTSGANYNVKVTVPKAYRNASPSSQSLTWKSAAVSLSNFVLN